MTLTERLDRIAALETELLRKGHAALSQNMAMYTSDQFVFGAIKRLLANGAGFRRMIEDRIFPCAAAIFRTQLDTAMRLNGLTLVDNIDACAKAVMNGEHFRKQRASDGQMMTDKCLREKLSEEHSWVLEVYDQTSDFIHLSGRLFYSSIGEIDEEGRTIRVNIAATDPLRPDEAYFEIVDTFFEATKLGAVLALAYLHSRTDPDG